MGKSAELREQALAKLHEAKALEEPDGSITPANRRRQEELFAEFKKLDDQAVLAAHHEGIDRAPSRFASVGGAIASLDAYDNRTMGGAMRFPTAGGGSPFGGTMTPRRIGSWADAFQRRFHAEGLLEPSGALPVAVPVRSEPVTDPRQARFVADIIPVVPAPNGVYAYFRQTVRDLQAAVVAVGAVKPTSDIAGETVDDRTRTIAHLSSPIPRQHLVDAAILGRFLEAELRYGLEIALDREILTGDGSGEHFPGILEAATGSQPFAVDILTTCRKSITGLELLGITPSAFVMNPSDFETAELDAADTFAASPGNTAPIDSMARRLWGIPVLTTPSITAGTAILGDFRNDNIALFVTEQATVTWTEAIYRPDAAYDQGATDWERNMLAFRAEMRANVAVARPAAFVVIDLSTGS